ARVHYEKTMIHNQTPPPPHPPTRRHRNAGSATEAHTPPTPPPATHHTRTPTKQRAPRVPDTRKEPQGPVLPVPNSVFAPPPPTPSGGKQQQQVFNDVPPMSNHQTHIRRLHGHTPHTQHNVPAM